MLEINVKKQLGQTLINANFSSELKGVTAIFGQSGAGKTTLINLVAGLTTPDEGVIKINGNTLFDSQQKINISTHKRNIGYVFQDARLFPNMNVKKNLKYGAERNKKKNIAHSFEDICNLLGINHLLDRMPSNLSGGEKQRVAIGRALLSNPEILLMDEPLASLDRNRRRELLDYIGIISKDFNIPIFYVTHSTDEIMRLASSLVIMENGSLKAFGNAVDILNDINMANDDYRSRDFGVICHGIVSSYDTETELAVISFGGGTAEVSSIPVRIGTEVRFKIHAIDVVLCAARPPVTSVRNMYSGVVENIIHRPNHFTDVLINIGIPIWARVSSQSSRDLDVQINKQMYVLIKSAVVSAGIIIDSPK